MNNHPINIQKLITDFSEKGFSVIHFPLLSEMDLKNFYKNWQSFFETTHFEFQAGLKKPDGYYHYWNENRLFEKIGIPQQSFYFTSKTCLTDFPLLQDCTQTIFKSVSTLARTIMKEIAKAFSQDIQDAIRQIDQYDESLRIIYSPKWKEKKDIYIRNRSHEDIDILTLLLPATQKGLQYQNDQEWITVDYQTGDVIINPGDALQILTHGKLKSPTHRVVALDEKSAELPRLSMAYFLSLG